MIYIKYMNESAETHGEGSPAIEQAEQNALGTTTYQKAEIVHRFADSNPWFHPLVLGVGAILIVVIGILVWRLLRKKS